MNNIKDPEVIIIGAGLTGLTLANCLTLENKSFLILEKSLAVGGRIATRRIEEMGFDHGALFLSPSLLLLSLFETTKVNYKSGGDGIYVEGGMNRFPKSLGANMPILKEKRVEKITAIKNSWQLETDKQERFCCEKLIITAPVPQSLELLTRSNLMKENLNHLRELDYTKALIMLLVLDTIPNNLHSFEDQGYDFTLMRERSLHPTGVIVEMPAIKAEELFEKSDEEIENEFLKIFKDSPLKNCQIKITQIKKWRYARALKKYPHPFIEVAPSLFLAGDSFGDPVVSAAALAQTLKT